MDDSEYQNAISIEYEVAIISGKLEASKVGVKHFLLLSIECCPINTILAAPKWLVV